MKKDQSSVSSFNIKPMVMTNVIMAPTDRKRWLHDKLAIEGHGHEANCHCSFLLFNRVQQQVGCIE